MHNRDGLTPWTYGCGISLDLRSNACQRPAFKVVVWQKVTSSWAIMPLCGTRLGHLGRVKDAPLQNLHQDFRF